MADLIRNYHTIQQEIENFCKENNYQVPTILIVSKNQEASSIQELYNKKLYHFGENKVQELILKNAVLPKDIIWHFIGNLQLNKVKKCMEIVSFIHSVSSIKLLQKIIQVNQELKRKIKLFLQVNLTETCQRNGILPTQITEALKLVKQDSLLEIIGLMTLPLANSSKEEIATNFAACNKLSKKYKIVQNSMGMSCDYLLAIANNTSFIRLGSIIFK